MAIDALIKQIENLSNQVEKKTVDLYEPIPKFITEKAKGLAPVDTGFLKSSIIYNRGNKNWFILVMASYGIFVEYGTSKQRAQPFIRPSINEAKQQVKLVANNFDILLNEVFR